MKYKEAEKMLQAIASQLSEHFEAVQIIASYPIDGGTQTHFVGRGNWWARQGMARYFIDRDQAVEQAREIKQAFDNEDLR